MIKQAAAQAGDAITQKATYVSAGMATIFGMNADVFAALCGVGLGLLTFLLNLWYKYQVLQLEKRKYEKLEGEKQDLKNQLEQRKADDERR